MRIHGNQYIAEMKLKNLAIPAALGLSTLGIVTGGAKLAGVGRFAPQPQQQVAVAPSQAPVQAPVKAQVVKPQEVKKAAEPKKDVYEFPNENVKKLYGALVSAEHRGFVKDPHAYESPVYVRTRADRKSSAYGPAQITTSLAQAYHDPKSEYDVRFIAQGKKFLSSNPKHETHGLGKAGELSGEEHHSNYQRLATRVMYGKAKELGLNIDRPLDQKQFDAFVQHWRHGKSSGKQPEKWYTDTTRSYYFKPASTK